MTTFNGSMIYVQNDEDIGPQIEIAKAEIVEVKYDGHTLWVNVDEVCRLRISKVKEIRFDTPGVTDK